MQNRTNVRTDQDVYHNARKHHSNKFNGHLAVSVPDAAAWHAWRLLNEQPLQPGLSTPWMQNGYWVTGWPQAGPHAIASLATMSNAKKKARIIKTLELCGSHVLCAEISPSARLRPDALFLFGATLR